MLKKRVVWLMMLGVLYMGMMGAGSCGKKALDAIGNAKTAIEQARDADAPTYAADQFQSAEDKLQLAQQQYDKYLFKRSEDSARDAEASAREALELAMKAKKEKEAKEAEDARIAALKNPSSLFSNTVEAGALEDQARAALHDVHFDFDSSSLSDAAQSILTLNAEWLNEHYSVKVEIEGHCDERGTEEYNLALGAKRAKAVYDYMVKAGVDASRMKTISYGASVPLDPGHNEEAWAKNRRGHFAVMQ